MGIGGTRLLGACLGVALSTLIVAGAATAGSCDQLVPTAMIEQGMVEGFRDIHCNAVYLGIPFAATTGGQNRCVEYSNLHPLYHTLLTGQLAGEHRRMLSSRTLLSRRRLTVRHVPKQLQTPNTADKMKIA